MEFYSGCSGFYYESWKGIFYPPDLPKRNWLSYYSQHFNTVEINSTFVDIVGSLNNLEYLELQKSEVSTSELQELQHALPGVSITVVVPAVSVPPMRPEKRPDGKGVGSAL